MKSLRVLVLLAMLGSSPKAFAVDFERADCNRDGGINLADAIYLLNYLYGGAATPLCLDACDVNDDGVIDIADPIFHLNFLKGPAPQLPPLPFNMCGADPTADGLDCAEYPPCP